MFGAITRTKWADMVRYEVALPTQEIASALTGLIRPCINKMMSAIHEARSLAAQRHRLLPQLVSGESRAGNYLAMENENGKTHY